MESVIKQWSQIATLMFSTYASCVQRVFTSLIYSVSCGPLQIFCVFDNFDRRIGTIIFDIQYTYLFRSVWHSHITTVVKWSVWSWCATLFHTANTIPITNTAVVNYITKLHNYRYVGSSTSPLGYEESGQSHSISPTMVSPAVCSYAFGCNAIDQIGNTILRCPCTVCTIANKSIRKPTSKLTTKQYF